MPVQMEMYSAAHLQHPSGIIESEEIKSTAQRERRRIQNRMNQRALRQRKICERDGKKTFKVQRWRINEDDEHTSLVALNKPKRAAKFSGAGSVSVAPSNEGREIVAKNTLPKYPLSVLKEPTFNLEKSTFLEEYPLIPPTFPLSADHLLHLVHFNVFRALISNKAMLRESTALLAPDLSLWIVPVESRLCDGVTVIRPLTDRVPPPSMRPTGCQRHIPHYAWINAFPDSTIRDRLIERQGCYDDEDLFSDLIGELFPSYNLEKQMTQALTTPDRDEDTSDEEESNLTQGRKGLIVWGDPWHTSNWEVTPGFAKKWAWLVEGCDELIASTNRWRALRGETPIFV